MIAFYKRTRLEVEDWLRYHPRVRRLACWAKRRRARNPDPGDSQAVGRAIVRLCAAARLADDEATERQLQQRIVALTSELDAARLDWNEFVPDFRNAHIPKAAILKPYVGPREKGVLFVSFENLWVRLLRPANYRELAARYTVVVAPSFSPAHTLVNYAFPAMFPGPVFTLLSHPKDRDVFPRMSPNLIPVPLYASSWVNAALFEPIPKSERPYDLLMVANFAKFKRHQAFFSALRAMPKALRILLIGQDQDGRSADTIRETARWYGVGDRFTLLTHLPYREMPRHYCLARASVVLSKREGSCVAIAESLFADTPAAMLREAVIGSRVFINEQTGRFLDAAHLARDLTDFVAGADRYSPRAWAEANITCGRATTILNEVLQETARAGGQEWSQDIAPMQWAPDPRLVRPEDRARLAPERAEFLARFGLEIGPPLVP